MFAQSLIKNRKGKRPGASVKEEMRAMKCLGLVSTFMSQKEKINKQLASLFIFYFSNIDAEKDNWEIDSNIYFSELKLDSA